MPSKTDWFNRTERLHLIEKLFLKQHQKLRTSEVAAKFGISEDTALHDLYFLSSTGWLPLVKDGHY
jgi:DeoR/GlpR family transcriptional regulator of sugar metabolism